MGVNVCTETAYCEMGDDIALCASSSSPSLTVLFIPSAILWLYDF